MTIPFIIGKTSNGDNQLIDLADTQLLMVSFCNEEQLQSVILELSVSEDGNKHIAYAVTNTRRLEQWGMSKAHVHIFLKDDPAAGTITSRKKLLEKITAEIKKRKQLLKKRKITSFSRYHSLNLWNEEKLSYQFFIVDDVWDLVISKPKSLGLDLINIMLNGPAAGIHTIIGSEISYHNLLPQLVNLNPAITTVLRKKYGIPEPKQLRMLGAALTFTTENYVFFKSADGMDDMRLYR